jgi:hypothetical protein
MKPIHSVMSGKIHRLAFSTMGAFFNDVISWDNLGIIPYHLSLLLRTKAHFYRHCRTNTNVRAIGTRATTPLSPPPIMSGKPFSFELVNLSQDTKKCPYPCVLLTLFFKLYIYPFHLKFPTNLNYKISTDYNKIKYICCYKL